MIGIWKHLLLKSLIYIEYSLWWWWDDNISVEESILVPKKSRFNDAAYRGHPHRYLPHQINLYALQSRPSVPCSLYGANQTYKNTLTI